MTKPPPDIEPDVQTLADLPFHVMGRYPGPLCMGRCRNGEIVALSSKELFERVRDLALGLGALGMEPGDRVELRRL